MKGVLRNSLRQEEEEHEEEKTADRVTETAKHLHLKL